MCLLRWHRLGISIKGNSATAILDCNDQDTQEIKRNEVGLKTDGVILFGQEIDDKDYFDVRLSCSKSNLMVYQCFLIVGGHPAPAGGAQPRGGLQPLH